MQRRLAASSLGAQCMRVHICMYERSEGREQMPMQTQTHKEKGGGEGGGGETAVGDGREREMWKPEDCERGFTTTETTQVEKLTEKEKGESNRTEGQQIRGSRTCAAAFACLLLPRPRRVRS